MIFKNSSLAHYTTSRVYHPEIDPALKRHCSDIIFIEDDIRCLPVGLMFN